MRIVHHQLIRIWLQIHIWGNNLHIYEPFRLFDKLDVGIHNGMLPVERHD